jgi:hypothetical protein
MLQINSRENWSSAAQRREQQNPKPHDISRIA